MLLFLFNMLQFLLEGSCSMIKNYATWEKETNAEGHFHIKENFTYSNPAQGR